MRKAITAVLLASLLIPLAQAGAEAGRVESSVYRVTKTKVMRNSGDHPTLEENFSFTLLDNRDNLMDLKILDEEIRTYADYEDIKIEEDSHKHKVTIGGIEPIDPGEEVTVEAEFVIKIESHPEVKPEDVGGSIPPYLGRYTDPVENAWHSDEEPIKSKARELTENVSSYYSKAKEIFEFVQGRLEYSVENGPRGDLWAYQSRRGDCSEYASLFISLARAAGIPANFVAGYHYYFEGESASSDDGKTTGHAFASVYLPGAGWTAADPTEAYGGGGGSFGGIDSRYIIEMLSDGSDINFNEPSEIPVGEIFYKPNPKGDSSIGMVPEKTGTTIEPLAALVVETLSFTRKGGKLEITVEITNKGTQEAKEVNVGLSADNRYFDVVQSERQIDLGPENHEILKFDLVVKESAEDEQLVATASYDSENYGILSSSDKFQISAQLSPGTPSPSDLIEPIKGFLEKYFYLIMLIGIVVAGVGFAARR